MDMSDKPMGGTELMYEELMKHLPQEYKDKFSIFNYHPHATKIKSNHIPTYRSSVAN